MVNVNDILSLIYDEAYLFIAFSFAISFILYSFSRNYNLGLSDPINFFWTFTFGTSYAVVLLLFVKSIINFQLFVLILYSSILLLFFMSIGFRLKFSKISIIKSINFNPSPKKFAFFLIVIYIIMASYYIYKIDWNMFFISRFEANKGLGPIARIIESLRLLIIGFLFIQIIKNRKKTINILFLILFILLSSIINGAKFSIIEPIYLMLIIYSLYNNKIFKIRIFKLSTILMFLFFILFSLYFTNKLAHSLQYSSNYTNLHPAIELLIARIIANGDMYYLGLSNNIFIEIVENQSFSFLALLVRPYLGESLTQNLFPDGSITNIGRHIWIHWYPDSINGGSTDHFDLAAHAYLGTYMGSIFICIIGFIIGRLNKIKMSVLKNNIKKNEFRLILFSVLYIKIYYLLLSPIVGLSLIIDIFFTITLLSIFYASTHLVVSFLGNKK